MQQQSAVQIHRQSEHDISGYTALKKRVEKHMESKMKGDAIWLSVYEPPESRICTPSMICMKMMRVSENEETFLWVTAHFKPGEVILLSISPSYTEAGIFTPGEPSYLH